jgi:Protein of unknown function with PCYCGC motif
MKKLWIGFALILAVAATIIVGRKALESPAVPANQTVSRTTPSPDTTQPATQSPHVPAHFTAPPSASDLGPVLASAQFTGKTREAYEAVSRIPATIAQMPCYCHCDRGMGHKSLHSCFEDDHAAHCAVCIDEALMVYRLQKEGRSPAEIREQIIARFAD